MAAIDVIFDVKPDEERVHQFALGPLLVRSHLLRELSVHSDAELTGEFVFEPVGRLFDLHVRRQIGSTWLELKVDGDYRPDQLRRQLAFLQSRPEDTLVYLLLGHSRFTIDRQTLIQAASIALPQPGQFHIADADDLILALENPRIVPERSERRADVRDLAGAYRDLLLRLRRRSEGFREKAVGDWSAGDFYGFFDHCRRQIPAMRGAGMGYVPNQSGGFYGCWWGWAKLTESTMAYLQIEGAKLCIKIEVSGNAHRGNERDRALQRLAEGQSASSLHIRRPARLGFGDTMTIGLVHDFGLSPALSEDWRARIEQATSLVNSMRA